MSHVQSVCLDVGECAVMGNLYKSSSVCSYADSRLLLPFNIPLNRTVNATTLTLRLLPALSFCTCAVYVSFYGDLCRKCRDGCMCVMLYSMIYD